LKTYGVTQNIIDIANNHIISEGMQLFKLPNIDEKKMKKRLQDWLLEVQEAIMTLPIPNDPLDFYRPNKNPIFKSDPFTAASLTQIRPIAAMYLAFPAGSGEVERGFSQTKLTMTDHRNSMHEQTLEELTVIADYANQPYYSFNVLTSEMVKIIETVKNN